MARRISIALLLIALFWVGEPAYALWKIAADHACCLAKPAAAEPSCHGMAHHADGVTLTSRHQHSDCPHDCCTKQRTGSAAVPVARIGEQRIVHTSATVLASGSTIRAIAIYAVSFERGPPSFLI